MKTLYDKSGNKVHLNDYENLISDALQIIFPGRIGYEQFYGKIYIGGLDTGIYDFNIIEVLIYLNDSKINYSELTNCYLTLSNGFLTIIGNHKKMFDDWKPCIIQATLKITKR